MKKHLSRFTVVLITLIALFLVSYETSLADTCKANYPHVAPVLVSAVSSDQAVTLTWTQNPVAFDHYLLNYGPSDNTSIEYGNPNIGGSDLRSYTVNGLTNGIKYYFHIKPINICKPGNYSNKLFAIAGGYSPTPGTANLSLYKPSTTKTATLAANFVPKGAKPRVLGTSTVLLPKPLSLTWQLLVAEIVLLVSYFFLLRKSKFVRHMFSILIPLGTLAAFFMINKTCITGSFFCKYFLQLDIVIYVIIIAVFKLLSLKSISSPQSVRENK